MFSEELVSQVAREMKVADLQNATIGDVLLVASRLEELTGIPFIRWIRARPAFLQTKWGLKPKRKPSMQAWAPSIRLRPECLS